MLMSAADRKQEIVFHVLRNLPYPVRILLSGSLLLSGVMVQAYGVLWAGVVAIFAGVLLLTTRGYQNVARPVAGSTEWSSVRPEDVQRILDIDSKQSRWDVDAVDISNGLGFVTLAALAAGLGWLSYRMGGLGTSLGQIIAFDSAAALLPFWVTGLRSVLKNNALVIKTNVILQLHASYNAQAQSDEQFQFQMQTAPVETGGKVPRDVKAMVRFPKAPEGFHGLQIQIAINSVQGSDYPYAYCVLVAKPGFGLADKLARVNVNPGPAVKVDGTKIVIESEVNAEAEVMVFRQETAGTGYKTSTKQAQSILNFALDAARKLSGGG